ncbi:MAG TPA: asparagine synthase (glutamine-hydrolyzing), partial [Blastocatellia bacterium]|nr:asparagine synthase (glutamine-hydrolyzing) [Blastocatellia bacterium]
MCGICGVALTDRDTRSLNRAGLERMTDVLEHRGPDDRGVFLTPKIGLGHRRLAIVDVRGGRQPMSNEDESIWIVFNGEIYNHKELRQSLERGGHHYKSSSDTETILHLYEEVGERVVEKLRGMFAFAIFDSNRGSILLARDRLGIKPLYYYIDDNGSLYFGSEIKAILEYGALKPAVNIEALPDYLANRAPSGEQTLFANIRRLPPAHTLTWCRGRVEKKRYWQAAFGSAEQRRSEESYVEDFSQRFRESVELRLMADVPLGMFLSGGIDSSSIAAIMSDLVPGPIKTFSVAFAEREANELAFARIVSREFKTDHYEVVVDPEQFFDAIPMLVYQEDEPIAHPSSIPLYFVSKLASRHVKVVLTGEGSDELLGGYSKYWKTLLNLRLGSEYRTFVPLPLRSLIRSLMQIGLPHSLRRKIARTFLALEPTLEDLYFDNFSVFSRREQFALLSQSTRSSVEGTYPYGDAVKAIASSGAATLLDVLLAADIETYLHELLMKQDQMSMAASIESRVPFLDHKLVELACSLPSEMKLKGLTTKRVLRKAMRRRLPEPILN